MSDADKVFVIGAEVRVYLRDGEYTTGTLVENSDTRYVLRDEEEEKVFWSFIPRDKVLYVRIITPRKPKEIETDLQDLQTDMVGGQ